MASGSLYMENKFTGGIKEAAIGFSWTTFFFGPFPAAFRGDWSNFFIMLLLALVTGGISQFYFIFKYNKWYIKKLIGEGYRVKHSPIHIDLLSAKLDFPVPVVEDK